MLLMVEKGTIGRICHSIFQCAKANSKNMKNYDKNKESLYLQYWNSNNWMQIHVWEMLQKLPVNNFGWIKDTSQFNEDYIKKNYNQESDEGYLLEVDAHYLEKLLGLYNDLLFLPERMTIEKVKKLVSNLHDKIEYVMHIKNLKEALNNGLVLKKVDKLIKFNQNAWLKLYIDMNNDLRKKAIDEFEKDFFQVDE